jgi:hypothetical protein
VRLYYGGCGRAEEAACVCVCVSECRRRALGACVRDGVRCLLDSGVVFHSCATEGCGQVGVRTAFNNNVTFFILESGIGLG